MQLQVLENNPLDSEQVALFTMFEREGFSDAQRRDFIRKRVLDRTGVPASE